MIKILILCAGNSSRSQMAEGYLRKVRNMIKDYIRKFIKEELD